MGVRLLACIKRRPSIIWIWYFQGLSMAPAHTICGRGDQLSVVSVRVPTARHARASGRTSIWLKNMNDAKARIVVLQEPAAVPDGQHPRAVATMTMTWSTSGLRPIEKGCGFRVFAYPDCPSVDSGYYRNPYITATVGNSNQRGGGNMCRFMILRLAGRSKSQCGCLVFNEKKLFDFILKSASSF